MTVAGVVGDVRYSGLDTPPEQRPIVGGRRGHHSEHLGHVLAVMQHLPRSYPNARW